MPRPKTNRQQATTSQASVRLNKAIADAGIASRRAADALISEGRVKVNGKPVLELGTKVTPQDSVTVNGKLIGLPERLVYILLNKPRDMISTTNDERGRRTVLSNITRKERLYPVGRLDRQTTGVLLITNDGDLAARLMHPRYGIERVYDVHLDQPLKLGDSHAIAAGVELSNGEQTQPCRVVIARDDHSHVTMTLREGKNREVRRLFEAFGYNVERLHRTIYAGLNSRSVPRGEWRYLEQNEISHLRRLVHLDE